MSVNRNFKQENKAWSDSVWNTYQKMTMEALEATGEKGRNKQHAAEKLTARERIELLFDRGSFQEINLFSLSQQENLMVEKKHYYGDGVICGFGKINGKGVYAISSDATISGGAGGEEYIKKVCRCLQSAISTKSPFVSLNESGGARIEEGINSLAAYSTLFKLNTMASGYIPQIAAIMGNCAGGASYSPILHDFLFMTQKSQMYITGPQVIKALTGETVSMDELGGSDIHAKESGQIHFVYSDDKKCIEAIRNLLSYLPQNCSEKPAELAQYVFEESAVSLEELVPENTRQPYDIRKVINVLCDKDSFLEIQEEFARNVCVGLARICGKTIGIIANQPMVLGGALECDASDKASRFIRTCDCFNIPLVTLVDVPAFMPGLNQEKKGIIRHGAKLLYSFAEATVPKITVILRKAYGGAYCAMNSKNLGSDMVYAWPISEIAVMGADGAVGVICKKEIEKADNPEQKRQELIARYKDEYLNPYYAAKRGLIDEIIRPEDTRNKIISALELINDKEAVVLNKKHGNIPL